MLNTSELMSGALQASQRSDFGESDFEVPLNSLVDALNREGQLNDMGIGFHSARLTDLLSNRLRMEVWLERYPEILEETINQPIVVIGLPRTGTTLLHRTIAADKQLLAPLWYEVRQPSPLNDNFVEDDARIPIAQAEVSTNPPTDLVTTNQEGYFFITRQVGGPEGESEIKPGNYEVKVSKDGFVTLSLMVSALKGNVWANKNVLQPERALVDTVAPDVTEDPDSVSAGGAVMEGM